MADSEVNIGISTTTDSSGATEAIQGLDAISKETAAATVHATRLMSIIGELMHQLDGMDSEPAKVLRQELAQLGETINGLDIERLKHLDNILANIEKTGAEISSQGVVTLTDDIAKLAQEAAKFQQTFTNANAVTVDVNVDGMDSLDALRTKIEALGEANALVDSLKEVGKEAEGLSGDQIPYLKGQIADLAKESRNLTPESVERLRNGYSELAKTIEGLPEKQRRALKSFDLDRISRQLDGLQNKIGTAASRIKGGGEAIHATNAILKGDFEGFGAQLVELVKNSKAWTAAVGKVGMAKAAASISIAIAGMQSLVTLAKQWAEYIAQGKRDFDESRIVGARQSADAANDRFKMRERARELNERRREIGVGEERARRENELGAREAEINRRRNYGLMSTRDPAERERINRAADRELEDIGYERELADNAEKEATRQAKLEAARQRLADMTATRNSLSAQSLLNANLEEEFSKGVGPLEEYMKNLAEDVFGVSFKEDAVRNIKEVADLEQYIADLQMQFKKMQDDAKLDIRELESQASGIEGERMGILKRRNAAGVGRITEDREREYGYAEENAAREREVSERRRRETEADAEDDLRHKATMQNFAEKRAAIADRLAMREKELQAKEKELAEYADIPEQNLTRRQRRRRGELEQDIDRLRGQTREDRSAIRQMDRQGDTETYGRRREYAVQRRDEREADREMLRSWRMRRLGLAGRTNEARSEVAYRQGLLEEEQKRMRTFTAGVSKRTGRKFRYEDMTDEEKARFDDIRADIQMRKEGVRSAQGSYMDALHEGEQKNVEFREGLKESNRLTALGLAGGGEFQWGKDTASNTKEMVKLLSVVAERLGGGEASGAADSSTFGY